jgi:hypothetical protein
LVANVPTARLKRQLRKDLESAIEVSAADFSFEAEPAPKQYELAIFFKLDSDLEAWDGLLRDSSE